MEVRMTCPECEYRKGSYDSGKHLYYNTEKRTWFCFRCSFAGRGELADVDSIPHSTQHEIKLSPNPRMLHDLLIGHGECMTARAARRYLVKHHLDPEKTAFERRLMIEGTDMIFPVYRGEKLVYFQKRNLFSKMFLNPPVDSKPLFWTSSEPGPRTVVVESFVNACRIDQWVRSAATFGKFLSDEQAEEIASQSEHVDIVLDAGEHSAALKMARKFRCFGVRSVFIKTIQAPTGTDVCDLTDEQCRRLLGVKP